MRSRNHKHSRLGTTNYWDGEDEGYNNQCIGDDLLQDSICKGGEEEEEEEEVSTQPFAARAYDEPGPYLTSVQIKELKKKERRLEQAWKEYRKLRNEYQEFVEGHHGVHSFVDGRTSEEWKRACWRVEDKEKDLDNAQTDFLVQAAKSLCIAPRREEVNVDSLQKRKRQTSPTKTSSKMEKTTEQDEKKLSACDRTVSSFAEDKDNDSDEHKDSDGVDKLALATRKKFGGKTPRSSHSRRKVLSSYRTDEQMNGQQLYDDDRGKNEC